MHGEIFSRPAFRGRNAVMKKMSDSAISGADTTAMITGYWSASMPHDPPKTTSGNSQKTATAASSRIPMRSRLLSISVVYTQKGNDAPMRSACPNGAKSGQNALLFGVCGMGESNSQLKFGKLAFYH